MKIKLSPHTRRLIRKFVSPIQRIGLKNKEFSVIANNCWGGILYDKFGLPYQTPTIGLAIYGKDYVKFCCNLGHYLSIEPVSDEKINAELRKKQAPDAKSGHYQHWIAHLDDITICFVHYPSVEEAIEKWNRRRKRVHLDKIILKFDDDPIGKITKEDVEVLAQLPYQKIYCTTDLEQSMKYDFAYLIGQDIKEGEGVDYIHEAFNVLGMKKIKEIINKL